MNNVKKAKSSGIASQYTECIACSGNLKPDYAGEKWKTEICEKCDGFHLTVSEEIYRADMRNHFAMVAQKPDDEIRYFDISVIDETGSVVDRTHGWMVKKIGFRGIVQFG